MKKREIILTRIGQLPVLPASVQKAMELLRDSEVDLGRLAQVMQHDPGITANILRLVNSAYFGAVHPISTLRDAVVRLGAKRVTQVLLTVAVLPRISGEQPGYDLPQDALLDHSLAIAVASELVAVECGIKAPAYTFTAGLLANIGKIVLDQFLGEHGEEVVQLAEQEGVSFESAECRVLGTDHVEVGAELLRFWNLPGEIVDVVRYRLQPEDCPRPNPALDLVHAGDAIARLTGMGQGLDGMQYRISEAVMGRLQLDHDKVEQIMIALLEHVQAIKALFAQG
ncbi:MAG TPA: HDOD domain-containing protein [Desulfonatronum sp.]|nr:HDOD domain-containing protein [Desulfonatronum sp.]